MPHRPLLLAFLLTITGALSAQIIYVDPTAGSGGKPGATDATGDADHPLATLQEAMQRANHASGNEAITIRLAPGLYVLTQQVLIDSTPNQNTPLTIEALIMPGDTGWRPEKMPVIQSVSENNEDYGHFNHCIGLQVERNNVHIRGLKFNGNPNPGVIYYYAIERHRADLKGLDISQCYFTGDKNTAPVQGAVFAQGADIHIDHCIFYGCKNAVLVFIGIDNFSLTHSIIYGAYEGALWYGYGPTADWPFTFENNIVAHCHYFFIGDKGHHPNYAFSHSLITENDGYLGINADPIRADTQNKPAEKQVRKTGKVLLDYWNLSPASAGKDIPAGIFK